MKFDHDTYQASMLGLALTLSTERRALPAKWAQLITAMAPEVAQQITKDLDTFDAQAATLRGLSA